MNNDKDYEMFSDVTNDNIDSYLESGQLKRIYLISPDYFGGSEGIENQFVGTPDSEKEKQRSDDELYDALKSGKNVSNFHIDLDYDEASKSIVPKRVVIVATIDGEDYRRVIEIW